MARMAFKECIGALSAAGIVMAVASCSLPVSVEKIETNQQRFQGLDYFLPKAIVDLTIKSALPAKDAPSGASPVLTLLVDGVHYVPDPSYHYSVKIDHSAFYDDDIAVTTDANALLQSVNSITTDRTPDIIQKLAEAPLQILTGQTFVGVKVPGKVFDIKYSLDPTSWAEINDLNRLLKRVNTGVKFSARPLVYISSDRSRIHPNCGINICFRTAMPYVLELSRTNGKRAKNATNTKNGKNAGKNGGDSAKGNQNLNNGVDIPPVVARQVVVLPNRHVVGEIPITRSAFVRKEFKLGFTNGMLTSVHLNNPSEVLAFIQIPITVAKAIVSIPSAMFQFKTTQITADNNLLTAQQKNLDLQRQIIDAQQKLVAAQVAAGS